MNATTQSVATDVNLFRAGVQSAVAWLAVFMLAGFGLTGFAMVFDALTQHFGKEFAPWVFAGTYIGSLWMALETAGESVLRLWKLYCRKS